MEEVRTTILSERHCQLGEGPTYDPATGTAWWFDILDRTLLEADLASGKVTSHPLPVMGSVLAVIDDAAPAARAPITASMFATSPMAASPCTRRSRPTTR